MKISLINHYAFYSILIAQVAVISDMIQSALEVNIPILRYSLYFVAAYYIFKAVQKNSFALSVISRKNIFIVFFLFWIVFLLIAAIPQLFNEYRNYIRLKQFLSGTGFIYLITFFVILKPNLLFYKYYFKLSFILAIIYLILTIPLFTYFTNDKANQGEEYGRVFAAGAAILLLTFSYHSKRINLISVATILLVLIVNMLLARRNQVLYFSSVIFFAYCIHIFHQSNYMRKGRLKMIMYSTFFILLLSLVFYVNIDQFSFFWERSQTGME